MAPFIDNRLLSIFYIRITYKRFFYIYIIIFYFSLKYLYSTCNDSDLYAYINFSKSQTHYIFLEYTICLAQKQTRLKYNLAFMWFFLRTCQRLQLPRSKQLQKRSYQPSGCYLHRSGPSSLREPVRKRILRTVHQNAYVP